jgi:hypothetical protein
VTRAYDEFLAGIFDRLSPALVALLLLAVAGVGGLLWYTYPAWLRIRLPGLRLPRLNWHWPRFRRPRFKPPRFKRRARKKKDVRPDRQVRTPEPDPAPRPVATALSVADRLAAEGR